MTQNVTTMQRSGSELEYRIDYTTKKETGINPVSLATIPSQPNK